MSSGADEKAPITGDNLPAVPGERSPASLLFAAISETPRQERVGLFREARDAVYLKFADDVLALGDETSAEERVAALELVGGALSALLPEARAGYYYFGTAPSEVNHSLNTALLAIRLEQIRARGYRLASSTREHLQEAFPVRPAGQIDNPKWQWRGHILERAKTTCLIIIGPDSLDPDSPAETMALATSGEYTEADLLRAAQIYTEARILQLALYRHIDGGDVAVDTDTEALAALHRPDHGRQITDESLIEELNKLEIRLRAMAIIRIGIPKYGEPESLIEHGELVFHPANCDEKGIPNGLSPQEAKRALEQHVRNIEFMAKGGRRLEARAGYAELLAKYQTAPETT